MKTFNQKLEFLKENSISLEFNEIYESLKGLATQNINQTDLNRILLERVSDISDKDSILEDFIIKEARKQAIENFGILEAIAKIKTSSVYNYQALKVNIELFEKEILIKRTPQYVLSEGFVNLLKPYTWDNTVKEEFAKIGEKVTKYTNEILIANTVNALRNDKNSSLYKGIIEKLEVTFDNIDKIDRNVIIKEFNSFSFNPAVHAMLTNLRIAESSNAFNVINSSNNAKVTNIISPVFIHDKGEVIKVQEMFYNIEEGVISSITLEEADKLGDINESFLPICRVFNAETKVEENKITIFKRKHKVEIVEEGDTKKVFLNGTEVNLNESNLGNALIYSGIYRAGEEMEISDIVKTYEHFNTIMDVEFGKVIESNYNEYKKAHVFNREGKITVNAIDIFNRKFEVNAQITGTKAVQIVKEHLNYDISGSLLEYLEVEQKEIAAYESKKAEIISNLKIVETELEKVKVSQEGDIMLKESVELNDLVSLLESEIETLKADYRKVEEDFKKKANSELKESEVNEAYELTDDDIAKNKTFLETVKKNGTKKQEIDSAKAHLAIAKRKNDKLGIEAEERRIALLNTINESEDVNEASNPGFKVGDKVKLKDSGKLATVSSIDSNSGDIICLPEGEDDSITTKASNVDSVESKIDDKEKENEEKGEEEEEKLDEAIDEFSSPKEQAKYLLGLIAPIRIKVMSKFKLTEYDFNQMVIDCLSKE